jgi:hypothetical protein
MFGLQDHAVAPVRRRSAFFAMKGDLGRPMRITEVVAQQLEHEGRRPFDTSRGMGSDYRYDYMTIGSFLFAVAQTLKAGAPSYAFTYDVAFQQKAVSKKLGELLGEIDARTR